MAITKLLSYNSPGNLLYSLAIILCSLTCSVIINNTNDAPAISLDGEIDPPTRQLSTNYTEGSGAQRIVSDVLVVDADPNSMIRRYHLACN